MAKGERKTLDLTQGSPMRLIIAFAVPVFLGMLFQQFYSLIDTMIVGKLLGVRPLAGVGSTSSLNFLVLGFCNGLCSGFAIPVAQQFGARQESELRKYAANCMWLCIAFGVILTVGVSVFCKKILILMNTPDSIFNYAYIYILIIFLGIPCTILYNMVSGILRSLGDSKSPLVFLAISSVLNIGLDVLFILPFKMGVAGAALATVIAQGVAGIISLIYIKNNFPILKISREEWKFRKKYAFKLCFIGVPMGLQYSITAIGTLVIQTAVNGLGELYVAGVTGASKLFSFVACPIEALGATMAPYAGQNVGAGKTDRLLKGVIAASICGFVVSAIAFAVAALFGRELSTLFVKKSQVAVLDYSYRFLLVSTAGFALLTLVNVVRFTIQGMGYSGFAITAGVLEMIARTLAGVVLTPAIGYLGVCLAHPMAWIFADVFLIPAFFICRKRLNKLFESTGRLV